jgi:DNA-binding response OmpR family regulator
MNRVYEFGEYRLDSNSRVLQHSGTVIPLTPKCLELLYCFSITKGVPSRGMSYSGLCGPTALSRRPISHPDLVSPQGSRT